MHLRLLEFVEYAAFTDDRKLIMSGVFTTTEVRLPPGSPSGPVGLPPSHLVWIVEASIAEGLRHDVALRVVDGDGAPVLETQLGKMEFILQPSGRPMRFQGRLVTNGIPLPGEGEYVFQLLVNGSRVGETTLYVDVIQPTSA